ncbi:flagellar hook-associated protein FlgK [Clostridium sp. DL-VIII]|uniref:flagellar hook-associated protein FlgK n=1 Tax=Clostridium sp. DL-VIII TaxID=641107 RepID=UPI00023B0644|nr:flagellar hook-associated protein FlgK [Clostridium sp. DL-VIII]EHJ01515.1 flagellar hook-associated protein FlgK [Clostridium sp. DL-VIII]
MAGLFDTFTIAKRGLNVQQGNINVTSHNIANADTTGYSRQRAVVETTRPFGGMSKFDTVSAGQVGTGAEVTSIQRIRDYFIDYQVRNESGSMGYYTQSSQTLTNVENVFGEPSDTGIQELTSQFFNSFQEVSKSPDKSDVKTVAIKNASALADALNYTYNQLEKNREDSQSLLQTNVTDVNSYLDQINELNKQIRSVSAVGQTPNDLMDKRDNLLDQLSYKFGINVDRDSFDTINLSSTEYPNSPLVKSDPSDGGYSRLSYVKDANVEADTAAGNYKLTVEYYPLGNENAAPKTIEVHATTEAELDNIKDSLLQNRILIGDKDGAVNPASAQDLNKDIFVTYKYETDSSGTAINNVDNNNVKGEIAANQAMQEKIKGYMDNLNNLAATIAYSVNAIQTGSLDASAATQGLSNNPIFVTYDENTKANTTSDTGMTAKNIRINNALISNPSLLNCNTSSTSGEGDGARANAIANLSSIKMNLSAITSADDLSTMDRTEFLNKIGITGFSGSNNLTLNAGTNGSTVDSYYKTIINNIAVANQEATKQVDNQESVLANAQDQRSSVSGVSLDEEMTNLIQFQHAYQANAKMISTVDELLDVVINGLKK